MAEKDLAAEHDAAVEAGDWDRVRAIEAQLITPTDNTERPEDGEQPPQGSGGAGGE